ncbi:MAG TPA: alpha-L-fucosidase [Terriglobia bacterium]|nr:alpha-L-fucosidase [Terriglobia bacterium]
MKDRRRSRDRFGVALAVTTLLLIATTGVRLAKSAQTSSTRNERAEAQRTKWFRDAKFGMFIHWGPYSLASVEASWAIMRPLPGGISQDEYVNLYKRFNPTQFDPAAWVRLAQEAGQRYIVFTTKHHDGFCMFNSSLTDYKITNTPYGKDVTAMLAKAAHNAGMPIGFYYSPPDMHNPNFRDTTKLVKDSWHGDPERLQWADYLDYMGGQLHELVTRYGPVALIWFDGLDCPYKYNPWRMLPLIHQLQPKALVNDRLGLPADFGSSAFEKGVPNGVPTNTGKVVPLTYGSPASLSQAAPPPEHFRLWEECMTINDTWAYNKNDQHYKSTKELIQTLADVASKGGNFLLDVGPTPEGTIQPEFVERLRAMGKWLKVNGESIYGTTYGPLQDLPFGKTTAKGDTVYLHVFDWPSAGTLQLSDFSGHVAAVSVLATGEKLQFKQESSGVTINVPPAAPDSDDSVIQIQLRR